MHAMKFFISAIFTLSIMMLPACSGKSSSGSGFPDDFNSLPDNGKVAYMMQHASADSVARFIIFASLGRVDGITIDTLNNATLMAYENYTDTALQTFSWEFDRVAEELPLYDKMRLRSLVGEEDPQRLGLTLGLEYMNQIRVKEMSVSQVMDELKALKNACSDNPDVYARFLIGFRTVLRYDKNSDMPAEIYSTFLSYDEPTVQEYYSRNKSHPVITEKPDSLVIDDAALSDSLTSETLSSSESSLE